MNHPYKTREGGATVTIFVPYDCKNHCPFCINKEEYGDMAGFSLEKIVQSIRRMDAITPKCDFVFTGGEPFADIEKLQIMLDEIPTTHRVFINTTLPVSKCQTEEDILAFAERNKHKITCINVSRHMQHYVVESNDDLLARLPQLAAPDYVTAHSGLDLTRAALNLSGSAGASHSQMQVLTGQSAAALQKQLVQLSSQGEAICWHTTGKPDMTKLEKIIYLADYIEPSRDFPGVEELRRVCYEDLDQGLLMGLEMTIEEMTAMGNPVHRATVEARDALKG